MSSGPGQLIKMSKTSGSIGGGKAGGKLENNTLQTERRPRRLREMEILALSCQMMTFSREAGSPDCCVKYLEL